LFPIHLQPLVGVQTVLQGTLCFPNPRGVLLFNMADIVGDGVKKGGQLFDMAHVVLHGLSCIN